MKNKTLKSKTTPPPAVQLARAAAAARKNSYSPYSNYAVGAAVTGNSGKIYSGANVENASYGLTMCAERAAIFAAVSAGEKEIKAVAICGAEGCMPCGACLQVMSEFCGKDTPVYLITRKPRGGLKINSANKLKDFYPFSFTKQNLK